MNRPLSLLLLRALLIIVVRNSLVFSAAAASLSSSHPDILALLALKSALLDPQSSFRHWTNPASATAGGGGVGSNNFTGPDFSGGVPAWCSWFGVECDPQTNNVTSLDLSRRNLSGDIPVEIRNLVSLRELNLSRNSFSGPLPGFIFDLTQLTSLDISHNTFATQFPPGISRLKSLVFLDAYSNNFAGPLPPEIGQLRVLEYLNLGGSEFDGPLPDSYGGLENLWFMHIAGNRLSGTISPGFPGLKRLEHLEIGYNSFAGGFPIRLTWLRSLTYVDISNCHFYGPLPPAALANMTRLKTLLLHKNEFSGEIPGSLGDLASLENLDLSDNQLRGTIPRGFASLVALRELNLMNNFLGGEVPPGLGDLPNLETFYIWNNSFAGVLPQNLGSNGKLQVLDVSTNKFTGPIPPSLCRGNLLRKLILFRNNFSGGFPPSLANCTPLARIRVQNNQLNGSVPHGFGQTNLTYLDLSSNSFSGPIPLDLARAPKLQYLNVSRNGFEVGLPGNIWTSPSLQIFSASWSRLVGPIPSFKGCQKLYNIQLADNSLTGPIPSDIDACEKLISLNLHGNFLSGEIPWQITSPPSVAEIDLSGNLLSGHIPSNFTNCNTLESFNVSTNRLTGPIPSTCTVLSTLHPSAFLGNSGLCGGSLPTRCADAQKGNGPKGNTGAVVFILAAAFAAAIFGSFAVSRLLLDRFRGRFSAGEGKFKKAAGPWSLTAFQRLNFTADDVVECLSDDVLGMGSTGTVYKAQMPGGEIIAVKRLSNSAGAAAGVGSGTMFRKLRGSGGGALAEVEALRNVRHRNVVRLLGWCGNGECTMLLYEYMANGSLEDLLHGNSKPANLAADWVTRYRIALGVAQGLCYLHHDCDPVIVHRDLKPSNILLDDDMEARVADFGVAKLVQGDVSMSVIAGSYGYIAPEYTYTMQVDEKSDIYSYGVVLMEILTGKRSVEAEFGEGCGIVDWVRSRVRNKSKDGINEVVDPNLSPLCVTVREEMTIVLRIALLCTSQNPADRPAMRDVVSMLQEAKPKRKLLENGESGKGFVCTNTCCNAADADHYKILRDYKIATMV